MGFLANMGARFFRRKTPPKEIKPYEPPKTAQKIRKEPARAQKAGEQEPNKPKPARQKIDFQVHSKIPFKEGEPIQVVPLNDEQQAIAHFEVNNAETAHSNKIRAAAGGPADITPQSAAIHADARLFERLEDAHAIHIHAGEKKLAEIHATMGKNSAINLRVAGHDLQMRPGDKVIIAREGAIIESERTDEMKRELAALNKDPEMHEKGDTAGQLEPEKTKTFFLKDKNPTKTLADLQAVIRHEGDRIVIHPFQSDVHAVYQNMMNQRKKKYSLGP